MSVSNNSIDYAHLQGKYIQLNHIASKESSAIATKLKQMNQEKKKRVNKANKNIENNYIDVLVMVMLLIIG
jgi:hypothetical protein